MEEMGEREEEGREEEEEEEASYNAVKPIL